MNLNFFIYLIMFLMSCFMFSYFYKFLLLNLLMMEFMMLNLMMFMYNFYIINNSMIQILYYLSFTVCEAVLLLTLLILLIRNYGNDNMKFFNLILW